MTKIRKTKISKKNKKEKIIKTKTLKKLLEI